MSGGATVQHADMRFPLLPLVVLVVTGGAADHAAEPVILITAFQPFAGRGVNGSATVAQRLDGAIIAGCRVTVLVMPVRWGEPGRVVPAAVARLQPRLLLGLGEGYPGRVSFERVGANAARPIPDEDKALPATSLLEAAGPEVRHARLDYVQEWFAGAGIPVSAGDDAGGYLCNELLYRTLGQPVAHCGFLHLPPQGGIADAAYAAPLLPVVRTLLAHNLPP